MGKLNWPALGIVALGGILLVIAWQGTHLQVWNALTGINFSGTNLGTPGAPYTLNGVTYPFVGGAGFGTFGTPSNPAIDPCKGLTGNQLALCHKNVGV